MFNKKPEFDARPESDSEKTGERAANELTAAPRVTPTVPEVRKRDVSVIGPTVRFKGELSANEDLLIEGHIEGHIAHQNKNLTVGRDGKVKADIQANAVEVFGEVDGNIHGDEIVRLAKRARVVGNINCARVVIEDGAVFSGSIDMSGDARSDEKSDAPEKKTSEHVVGNGHHHDSTHVGG